MNQLEVQYQDILHILDKLLANLGLMLEDYDVEYLTQADLYIEIFKIMFPVLEPVLNADFGEDITDEELIQYLIDVLAKDIIKMDLGHIRGELIAQGDAKNILNFLQLLFEISNMVVEKDDGDKDKKNSKNSKKNKNQRLVRSSGHSADQIASSDQSSLEVNQQYNSVQGINAEFSNSSVVESNQEPSDAGAEEVYEDVQGHRVQNNKMVFDQHQQMKAMKDGASRESRSVSRISEVSKSKESSEYDRGVKKMSKDEFNPAVLVKGRVASDNGGKRGSYTSDDIRELKGEHEEEEEDEEEDELEEEQEESDNGYIQEQQDMAGARQFTNEEEDDGLEQQEEYYKETNEEIDEDDDGFSEQMIKKISKEEVEDDLEYYPNDPINYNPLGKNQAHQARNSQSRSHEGEGSKARAIQSVDVKHSHHMENDDEEEETPEEEYEEEEELEEEEEQDEIVDEEEQDSQQREYYEGEYDVEGIHENDPRLAEYREEMEEVAEEEYEEEDDTENAEPNHHLYQVHQSGKKSVKSKGKGGKAKKSGTKKAVKAQPQPVVDYKKPKVEYRPLRPATAGMKRPQTAKSTKTTKVNKSNPVRSSGRKSNESTSSRSKKMMHSKSEKHLYVAEEQEPEQTQSEGQEDYSEDKGMEPKEYQPGDSQVPSQHGGIEEEQEQYEQEYEEEQAQQIPDGNVFKILSENVMRVKENLRENRAIEDVPFDDEHTVKMIRHQKEQYKQYLKDFVKDHQMREKKYDQMRQTGAKNFQKKMKSENIRDQHLQKDFANQQKSLYFKMRDEKVNYLRRIHKTIFELEKKRIIDEKKEYMEFRKTRNIEAVNMIDSIKNQYRHKLSILRENNANQQHERKIASEAQRTFIKTLENELRMDQMKEVERLKDKWRLEKERFDMMIKDEGFLEQKVMQLYKKGVF